MTNRVRIGDLLVQNGVITASQLEQAIATQAQQGAGGKRLGHVLVSLGFINEVQFARILSQQLSVPWVSLSHIDFSPSLLALVTREIAERFTVIPVYVRRERREGDTLYLAMDDPTHDEALRAVSESAEMPVRPMVAPPSDIRSAIDRLYAQGTHEVEVELEDAAPLPLRRAEPPRVAPSPRPATVDAPHRKTDQDLGEPTTVSAASAPAVVSHPGPAAALGTTDSAISSDQLQAVVPEPQSPSRPAVSMLLLDGTSMELPKPGTPTRRRGDAGTSQEIAAVVDESQPRSVEDRLARTEAILRALILHLSRRGLLTAEELRAMVSSQNKTP
ncbi:MAG: hypothetical protein Q8Q09_14880 [Deltaproteobacteria bacterium]|nr:hypothetical protein [Deltaproteobacteria bacterium]